MILAVLEVSWALLGFPWTSLGVSWDSLAALLECPWSLLGLSWASFGLTWEPLGSQGGAGKASELIFKEFVYEIIVFFVDLCCSWKTSLVPST